jgi:hypothetical protein
MTANAVVLDGELGVPLPDGDTGSVSRCAAAVDEAAGRLLVLAQGVARLLPVAGWSGVAATAADERLLDVAAALSAERTRAERAAEALRGCASRLRMADDAADEARLLLAAAHREQAAADARDLTLAAARQSGQWSGPRADGTVYDPAAVTLLRRAQERARESREAADAASRRLVDELTALSGRRVVRETGSWSTVLDMIGLVPGYGDALDLGRAGLAALDGHFGDAAVTGAASVPGPLGWLAGAHRVERGLDAVGDVARVVDDTPRARAVAALNGLTVQGRGYLVRTLPDDAAIRRFYETVLEPLGTSRISHAADESLLRITELPGGGRVVFRESSRSGGSAIDVLVDEVPYKRIHRAE